MIKTTQIAGTRRGPATKNNLAPLPYYLHRPPQGSPERQNFLFKGIAPPVPLPCKRSILRLYLQRKRMIYSILVT